ncbi:MAG: nucleotidyltransferase domain-containing protein [Candidatus Thiodiazotropha sp. (ex Lucinoma annulata)]|nr:nucleotidyltransferase domain-containing protein [Candidatus Thiodiazotropha sp. (ex Lucinoma annulata)]
MSQLGDALFTTTQQRVLGLLYNQPEKSFYTKEIIRMTGMGVATIKRELDRMLAAGILSMTRIGNQHHYQANPDCPIFRELQSIVTKTFGVADVIKRALLPFSEFIEWAFIFGSVASNKEISTSDIDLMIIGDVGFSEAINALHPIQEKLGRDINPKLYHKQDWIKMVSLQDAFVKEVLNKPRMDVIGDGHEFGELSGQEPGRD